MAAVLSARWVIPGCAAPVGRSYPGDEAGRPFSTSSAPSFSRSESRAHGSAVQILPEGVIPRRYRHVDEFSLNSNRKIDRKALTGTAAELLGPLPVG
jgi:hypothetical protein